MSPSQRISWARGLIIGCALGFSAASLSVAAESPPFRGLRPFAEAIAVIDTHYVDPVDTAVLLEGAIRGIVGTLDPHSDYLDAEEVALFESQTEGRFVGIGVEIEVRDGWLVVTSVFPNGPAAEAGVRAGDRVIAIDGAIARDLPLRDAVDRVRGEAGTTVVLALRRDGAEDAVVVHVRRAPIEVVAVESRVLDDGVLYARIRAFQESTAEELRRALDDALEATRARGGIRALVLDLRENGGGLYFQAVEVADEFLSDGVIVSTRGRDGRLTNEARATRRGTRPSWPLVVLVDGYTASASEIVAGALSDHGRAVLVGERTFGKGSVQSLVPLSGGGALKLTTGRYYTPSGRSIQAEGLEPDVVVPSPRPTTPHGVEPASERSLERHLEGGTAGPHHHDPSPLARIDPANVPSSPRDASTRFFPNDTQAAMAHTIARVLVEAD